MFFACIDQACNQLGTPGGTQSSLRVTQFFLNYVLTMSNTFFQGGNKICRGWPPAPPWLWTWHRHGI